jgi:HAD superfamily hydrolase (TIGR01549 family)
MKTKAILFDFGGTLDLDGIHWYDLWTAAYKYCKLEVKESDFRNAYFYAEEMLNSMPQVKKTYQDLIYMKAEYQLNYIYKDKYKLDSIYEYKTNLLSIFCYTAVKSNIDKSIKILELLSSQYELGVISNFYGNLDIVLEELNLKKYFKVIIDSKIVTIRKPAPEIYELASNRIGIKVENCTIVGDSYKQDIMPAKSAGYSTILLNKKEINNLDYDKADIIINTISDLSKHL